MDIEIHILQKLADGAGKYFLGQRRISRRNSADSSAWLISPDVPSKMQSKSIGDLPYNDVHAFSKSQIKANIPLGKLYSPFQWGIEHGEFIFVEEITCNVMELVVKCYQENISDYIEAVKLMKSLATPQGDAA